MEGFHTAIVMAMHPRPVGHKVCFVANNSDTRINVDAPLPKELLPFGITEDGTWRPALDALDVLNRKVMGGCCLECWCAALSFVFVVPLLCWCPRYKKQQTLMQEGIVDINNKYFVDKGVSVQWIPSSNHGPGGLTFYEVLVPGSGTS